MHGRVEECPENEDSKIRGSQGGENDVLNSDAMWTHIVEDSVSRKCW